MKHIIITRFLCTPFGFDVGTLLSDQMYKQRLQLLKSNLLPSLANQTNKSFELLLAVHDWLALDRVQALQKALAPMPFKASVIRYSCLEQELKARWQPGSKMIATRIDDDDFIWSGAAAEAQAEAAEVKGFGACGYTTGFVYVAKTKELYDYMNSYGSVGHIALFQSLIADSSFLPYTSFINPYSMSHVKVADHLKKVNAAYGCAIKFKQFNWPGAFIYYRHDANVSGSKFKVPSRDSRTKFVLSDMLPKLKKEFAFSVAS